MVMGDDSYSGGCGFKSHRCILDGHFFTYICCKNCIVCLIKTKTNEKEAGVSPFFISTNFNGLEYKHLQIALFIPIPTCSFK